jgi:hypothetical protein
MIVPAFDIPAPPEPVPEPPCPPCPPKIIPLLIRVAIVPAFDRPAPTRPPTPWLPRPPPVSAADRPAIGQSRDRAGIRDPCAVGLAAARAAPAIAPLLDKVVIVPAFDTPAPPTPPLKPPNVVEAPAPLAPPSIVPPLGIAAFGGAHSAPPQGDRCRRALRPNLKFKLPWLDPIA